jgi:hypothetical protein
MGREMVTGASPLPLNLCGLNCNDPLYRDAWRPVRAIKPARQPVTERRLGFDR